MDLSYNEDNVLRRSRAPEKPETIISNLIVKRCEDPEFLLDLKKYILEYYVDLPRMNAMMKQSIDYSKPYTTLSRVKVRSKSERDIADWLYRHRIEFEYEPRIQPGRFEFQPDFFISEANVYLEHVSNLSYPLKDKEIEMREAGKLYLKIHEKDTHDSAHFNKMMDRLIVPHLNHDISVVSYLDFADEFKGYEKFFRQFTLDIIQAINKIKIEHQDFSKIFENAKNDMHQRVRLFYSFLKNIRLDYLSYCTNKSYLDFNDLLLKTVSLLRSDEQIRAYLQNKFKYILVDEFQDVNTIQVELLKQLVLPDHQLFCVGDDWQSIYGWRGSNVKYIVDFQKTFPNSRSIKLDINYRSNNTIISASNEVIKNNEYKLDKEVKSLNRSGKKIYLYCAQKEENDGVEVVCENVKELLENGYTKDEILILTRTRKSDAYEEYRSRLMDYNIKITTIHQAKGLEARAVFIIGLTSGFMGFPLVRDTDRIFQIIKRSNFDLLMEEERRLFYVALTRAKEELFLISEVGNESEFIKEIPGQFLDRSNFLILNVGDPEKIHCISCGKVIDPEYYYCPFCGKKFMKTESIDEIIIQCLQSMQVNTGRSFLTKILSGSRSQSLVQSKQTENPFYGSLNHMTQSAIMGAIDTLISRGYIGIHDSDLMYKRPLLNVTEKGEELIRSS